MKILEDIKILTGQKKTTDQPTPSTTPPKTVLIVEDEKPFSNILEARLTDEGFKIIKAEDGEVGLKMATTHMPDIILLDLMMPVMDGKSMLHKLREIPECKKIPVIVLTNAGEIENIRETQFYSDAAEFLIKSNVTLDEIVKKIKTHALVTFIKP